MEATLGEMWRMFSCSERSPTAAEGNKQQTRVVGQGGSGCLGELPALGLGKNQVPNHLRNAIRAACHLPALHNGSGWSRYHFC